MTAKPESRPAGTGLASWGLPKALLQKLSRLGIGAPFDLVLHLPLRYEDETRLTPIAQAAPGAPVQVEGVVVSSEIRYRPRRQLVCRIADDSGEVHIRYLNFYPSQAKALEPGKRVRLHGELRSGFFGPEMVHPRFRVVGPDTPLPTALTPVYPTTAGLAQSALRKLIARALADADLSESVPREALEALGLPGFEDSVCYLQAPPPDAPAAALGERTHPAWRRMKFDELLAQQLSMRLHYRQRRSRAAPALPAHNNLTRRLLQALPFELTPAQLHAYREISHDLSQPHPMQRLLQGDVGSGKTVVAALAALQAIENGFQAAIMAPTEILAEQHYRKLSGWLEPLGVGIAWITGNQRKRERDAALAAVEQGQAMLAVGTHALFQERVAFQRLGLAVIDEQHRFGVHQRLALRLKGESRHAGAKRGSGAAPGDTGSEFSRSADVLENPQTQPHQLMMSATPIPRTLSMSYYADLDVSVINEMPPGRTPVATRLVADKRRDEVLSRVRDACMQGRQAYWVCPLIEGYDAEARSLGTCDREGGETARSGAQTSPLRRRGQSEKLQLQTALETFHTLRSAFPDLKVGLAHGRLSGADKAAVMDAFQRGEIQLLVATTVIEVGVDVPNASLMVIDHAERMGLAQLHQLRGRVGRGAAHSICILLYETPLSQAARERLRIIYENTDGFEIARQDLRLRGPGEFLGARQSGVPMLRFADLERDQDLLEAARDAAGRMLERHPDRVRTHLSRWMGGRHELLKV